MQKLSKVKINYFSHKEKLAFWINIYNASIMNVLNLNSFVLKLSYNNSSFSNLFPSGISATRAAFYTGENTRTYE